MERCPNCGRRVIVVNTFRVAPNRIQYRGCRGCGYRPPENKRIVPLKG